MYRVSHLQFLESSVPWEKTFSPLGFDFQTNFDHRTQKIKHYSARALRRYLNSRFYTEDEFNRRRAYIEHTEFKIPVGPNLSTNKNTKQIVATECTKTAIFQLLWPLDIISKLVGRESLHNNLSYNVFIFKQKQLR